MKLDNLNRTRLKLTIFATLLMVVALLFPMYMINEASNVREFSMGPAWGAFGGVISAIGLIIGYYVNKESARPSLLSTGVFIDTMGKKIMDGEDESDDEIMDL